MTFPPPPVNHWCRCAVAGWVNRSETIRNGAPIPGAAEQYDDVECRLSICPGPTPKEIAAESYYDRCMGKFTKAVVDHRTAEAESCADLVKQALTSWNQVVCPPMQDLSVFALNAMDDCVAKCTPTAKR